MSRRLLLLVVSCLLLSAVLPAAAEWYQATAYLDFSPNIPDGQPVGIDPDTGETLVYYDQPGFRLARCTTDACVTEAVDMDAGYVDRTYIVEGAANLTVLYGAPEPRLATYADDAWNVETLDLPIPAVELVAAAQQPDGALGLLAFDEAGDLFYAWQEEEVWQAETLAWYTGACNLSAQALAYTPDFVPHVASGDQHHWWRDESTGWDSESLPTGGAAVAKACHSARLVAADGGTLYAIQGSGLGEALLARETDGWVTVGLYYPTDATSFLINHAALDASDGPTDVTWAMIDPYYYNPFQKLSIGGCATRYFDYDMPVPAFYGRLPARGADRVALAERLYPRVLYTLYLDLYNDDEEKAATELTIVEPHQGVSLNAIAARETASGLVPFIFGSSNSDNACDQPEIWRPSPTGWEIYQSPGFCYCPAYGLAATSEELFATQGISDSTPPYFGLYRYGFDGSSDVEPLVDIDDAERVNLAVDNDLIIAWTGYHTPVGFARRPPGGPIGPATFFSDGVRGFELAVCPDGPAVVAYPTTTGIVVATEGDPFTVEQAVTAANVASVRVSCEPDNTVHVVYDTWTEAEAFVYTLHHFSGTAGSWSEPEIVAEGIDLIDMAALADGLPIVAAVSGYDVLLLTLTSSGWERSTILHTEHFGQFGLSMWADQDDLLIAYRPDHSYQFLSTKPLATADDDVVDDDTIDDDSADDDTADDDAVDDDSDDDADDDATDDDATDDDAADDDATGDDDDSHQGGCFGG